MSAPAATALPDVTSSPVADARPATTRRLVVVVPALGQSSETWRALRDRLAREPGYGPDEAEWMPFDHATRFWSRGTLETLARRLRSRLHEKWLERGGFTDVVLVGHSIGGLIARRAYLLGAGAVPWEAPQPWAARVSRVVLFAATNRGVNAERVWWLGPIMWAARIVPHPRLRGEDAFYGSAFVTNLRIDWIRYFGALRERVRAGEQDADGTPLRVPEVVNLLGDTDGLVSREDSRDVLVFGNARELEVADATHADLYRLDAAPDANARYALLRSVFLPPPLPPSVGTYALRDGDAPPALGDVAAGSRRPGAPGAPAPALLPGGGPRPFVRATVRRSTPEAAGGGAAPNDVTHIVFFLHGIRAANVDAWLEDLERRVREQGVPGVVTTRPTYGYFTAVRFALPSVRRRNARVFADWYAELLAAHPRAEFSIVAHSNGTYLLGETIRSTAGMRFRNVVLAGSVLPPSFPWDELVAGGQVRRVLNERASQDWPVGWLCSALNGLRQRDVGTGGYAGFLGDDVQEVAYHAGGHSAALRPENLDRLVQFVLHGACAPAPQLVKEPGRFAVVSRAMRYVGPLAVGLLAVGAAAFVGLGPAIQTGLAIPAALARAGAVAVLLLAIYVVGDAV